jgi:C-terminal processing protease CtpA/Prc
VADVQFAIEQLGKQCKALLAVKKIDWGNATKTFPKEAEWVKTDAEHLVLLARLLARLRDGHAEVRPLDKAKGVKFPDDGKGPRVGPGLFLCRSGKKIWVKNSWEAAAEVGVAAGSEVLKLGGAPAETWLRDRITKISDLTGFETEQHAFFHVCHWGLAEPSGTKLDLELRAPDGKEIHTTLTYRNASPVPNGPAYPPVELQSAKDVHFGKTAAGFGYIHVRRCAEDLPTQIDEALGKVGAVPGLVLDFRGNSGGATDHEALMGRFVPKGKTIAFVNRYQSAGPAPYAGPIVVIIDGTIRSTGETASGIFKEDGRAYMIGESATAGMSSQKTTIALPSGLFSLYVSVSSNKARFNDGAGVEGIGVQPHEIVELNPKDLAKKADTLILRAEEILRSGPPKKVPYDPKVFGFK